MGPTIWSFIHETRLADLPDAVVQQTQRCLLDLIGVAAAGTRTPLSSVIRDHAARHFASCDGGARMLFDGRRVSPPGAALSGGMTIDSLDAHDGHVLCKGHVGAGVFSALLAFADAEGRIGGAEFLTSLAIGYELGTRAGIALHATAPDYHTSGAWICLACAAVGARLLGLSRGQTREAVGIAEYHGPRSQMMRCVVHPTMVKDGSGWGAMAGVSAAYLAADGFTGAPALTMEAPAAAGYWEDLGTRWRILEQYFKPYPICRWAQPAVEAALAVQRVHGVNARAISRVEVTSFHQAVRLAARRPATTEAAQYSLPFPVAIALARQRLGAEEVEEEALHAPEALRLSTSMVLREADEYNARFPAERWAHVELVLDDGRRLRSDPAVAPGNPENPLSDDQLLAKYRALTEPVLGSAWGEELHTAVVGLADSPDLGSFLEALTAAVGTGTRRASAGEPRMESFAPASAE